MRKSIFLLASVLGLASPNLPAANPLLGEVEIEAASKVERDAGVWVDGQYVGFVKNMQGKDRLVLVPGEHRLLFKLVGYRDVSSTIVVEPDTRAAYRVEMSEVENLSYPAKEATAKLRLEIEPEEAAIFVNDRYVGHVDSFNGPRGMRLEPGKYRFTIALPGYQSFDTELNVRANQTYELKTNLQKGPLGEQARGLTAGDPASTR
jgi:hypothetical protein